MTYETVRATLGHLSRLYPELGDDDRNHLAQRLIAAVAGGSSGAPAEQQDRPPYSSLPGSDEVVLITYADTIVEPDHSGLAALARFWRDYLHGVMSTVHVLPFFVSTSDGGFSIADYRMIGPGLGTWDELAAVVPGGQIMADLVCNHGSAQSEWFANFRAGHGYGHDFFLAMPEDAEVSEVVRPRTHDVLVPFETAAGRQHVWATFSPDQVDFNFANPAVLLEFCSIIGFYLDRGVTRIRLDAIAYLWKRLGTDCIHLPETHEVVKLFRLLIAARNPSVLVTTETNVPHDRNISYFGQGDEAHVVYNFTLAPMIVWSVLAESSTQITSWLQQLKPPPPGCTFLNFIASHDGIGVRPLEGILDEQQLGQMIAAVEACGGSWSAFSTPAGDRPYELNVSLTDLLAGTDLVLADRFVAAHAVMLSMQGIPAFYVHSLISSPADHGAVAATKHKRDINRSRVARDEIDARLQGGPQGEVFDRLRDLIIVRRAQPAFSPSAAQVVHELGSQVIAVERRTADQTILAVHNVTGQRVEVTSPLAGAHHDLLTETNSVGAASEGPKIALEPWQVAWFVVQG